MRTEWTGRVESFLTEQGFAVPTDAEPATPIGRNNEHTAHWQDLHEEMTSTYRNLGRDTATVLMEDDE